jgi:flagellar protein FlaJ
MTKKRLKMFSFEITKAEIIGIIVAIIIAGLSFFFINNINVFYFILVIAFIVGGVPFFIALILESNVERDKEEMFLEFSRNLVESVRSGTPISKSIINIKSKDYGNLSPHINKLANQISLGIPVKIAFETFARDVGSTTVKRAVTIISEAENAGGEIEDILESVVKSVSQVEKLRKERRAAVYSLVMQGYIIFLIFIVIMIVMEYKILPIAKGFGDVGTVNTGNFGGTFGGLLGGGQRATPEELSRPFFLLLIVQGFFAGLVIGKLSEGSVKAGLKHSFILLVIALLVHTGANLLLGSP